VAREFGVPFLAGTGSAAQSFVHDSQITVDGDQGAVYQGKIESLIRKDTDHLEKDKYYRTLKEVLNFITPLELVDPAGKNFTPEGCRSMHDIIRFCHEKAVQAMFFSARPGSGRGSLKLVADVPLDVFLFDVGGGITAGIQEGGSVPLAGITSVPFQALWRGLGHPDVQWKQKPFDWDAYDKVELAGGIPPARDSFAFSSYAVIGFDYLHFNIRFGYHFTIVDVLCGKNSAENHCMLRFAGGGGDFGHRSLRIDFITRILEQLEFTVEKKGDMLEARLSSMESRAMQHKLDMLGRLLGATKLMDMVLEDEQMVSQCVDDFFSGRYSFSQEG
jgi:pyruvate,water dikinase